MADQQTTPSKGTPGTTPNGKVPSNQDAMFFFFIVKNMKSKADVDWAGVAAEHGFKNAEVAKVRFGQVKRKLGICETSTKKASARNKEIPTKRTPTMDSKVKKSSPVKGRKMTKGEFTDESGDRVKMENVQESNTRVKREDANDAEANAQLQDEMDQFVNMSPEPMF